MAYEEDPIFTYEPPNGEEQDEKRGRGCLSLMSLLLVVVMVGVSIPSLFWLFSLRQSVAEPIVVTVEVTATPKPTTVPVVEAVETAVSTPAPVVDVSNTAVNRIAYINADGHIMTIDPDGTGAQLLTSGNHSFQFPAWSPDSTQLAVIGRNNAGGAVYVIDAAADEVNPDSIYQGSSDDPFYLYWAPDGEQIGFISNDRFSGISLHVVPADGSDSSRVVSFGAPFYWHWADDSQGMLIHVGGSGFGSRVQMITVDGDIHPDELGDPGFFQSPGISADGRYWAYAEGVSADSSQLVVMDTTNGDRQVQDHLGYVAMNWSPNKPLLAYINGDTLTSESFVGSLRLLDVQTGDVNVLSRDKVMAFFWSPDGRYIAALSFVDPGAERDINGQAPKGKGSLAKPSAQFRLPELDLVIFDVETMEGRELLRFMPSLPFWSQFLPYFDQYALSHQIWSPDSNALVLPMQGEEFNQVVVVSIRSGGERLIAEGNMPFWSHR